MGTQTRPELSKKSTYWIPRHRYYELKHFVMQYPEWQEYVKSTDSMVQAHFDNSCVQRKQDPNDPVYKAMEKRYYYRNYINMCNDIAISVSEDLSGGYLIVAICNGYSYEKVLARNPGLPCSKDRWYEIYRKFFWMLDKKRL